MKKTILLFLGIFMLAGFSACKKEVVQPTNRTIYVDIPESNWSPNADNTVWTADADIQEIDSWIMDQGTVLADISFNNGETFEPLSSTYDQSGYRFEYGLGYILVDVQSTADNNSISRPGKALVKLVLVDSELVD